MIPQPMDTSPAPVTASSRDRNWAMGVHVGAMVMAVLTSWAAGLAGVLVAGVVYFLRRDNSPFVAEHARTALNFNASMFLYSLIAAALVFLTLGLALIVVIPVGLILFGVWVVASIMAAGAAMEGRPYRYPLALSLF